MFTPGELFHQGLRAHALSIRWCISSSARSCSGSRPGYAGYLRVLDEPPQKQSCAAAPSSRRHQVWSISSTGSTNAGKNSHGPPSIQLAIQQTASLSFPSNFRKSITSCPDNSSSNIIKHHQSPSTIIKNHQA